MFKQQNHTLIKLSSKRNFAHIFLVRVNLNCKSEKENNN